MCKVRLINIDDLSNINDACIILEAEVVAISDDITVDVGRSVFLVCIGIGEPDVEITWSFNGEPVVNTSTITIYQEDVVKGGRVHRQSFLQLCGLTVAATGGYTCFVSSGQLTASATTRLGVGQQPSNHLPPVATCAF